jgi:hypothetical protein
MTAIHPGFGNDSVDWFAVACNPDLALKSCACRTAGEAAVSLCFVHKHTNMKKAQNLDQLIDLVHEAVYEVDELRACLEHDDEEASTYTPYLDDLDRMLRELHESMTSGTYGGVGNGGDLAFMPLFKQHERSIPFRELLRTINATHREGYEP